MLGDRRGRDPQPEIRERDGAWKVNLDRRPTKLLGPPDVEEYKLPNPTLLRLHAVCARVANMSGAAAYLDSLHSRDGEDDSPVPALEKVNSRLLEVAIDDVTPPAHYRPVVQSYLPRVALVQ